MYLYMQIRWPSGACEIGQANQQTDRRLEDASATRGYPVAHAATRNGRREASWRGTCVPVIDWTKKLGTVVPNLLTHGLVQTPGWAARVQTSSATGPPPIIRVPRNWGQLGAVSRAVRRICFRRSHARTAWGIEARRSCSITEA